MEKQLIHSLAKDLCAIMDAPLAFTQAHINNLLDEVEGLAEYERSMLREEIGVIRLREGFANVETHFKTRGFK